MKLMIVGAVYARPFSALDSKAVEPKAENGRSQTIVVQISEEPEGMSFSLREKVARRAG